MPADPLTLRFAGTGTCPAGREVVPSPDQAPCPAPSSRLQRRRVLAQHPPWRRALAQHPPRRRVWPSIRHGCAVRAGAGVGFVRAAARYCCDDEPAGSFQKLAAVHSAHDRAARGGVASSFARPTRWNRRWASPLGRGRAVDESDAEAFAPVPTLNPRARPGHAGMHAFAPRGPSGVELARGAGDRRLLST